jgi:hypothetical protein
MATINFKYDPSRVIMLEMVDEVRKVVKALETRDTIVKSLCGCNQPLDQIEHLQSIIDTCDEILHKAVGNFIEWRRISLS